MKDFFISHGRWYYTLTILTSGLLAWVPFLHASRRLPDAEVRTKAWVYGGVALLLLALPESLYGIAALAVIVTACVQLRPLRAAAHAEQLDQPGPVLQSSQDEQAVQGAMYARQRRQEARALAERDPALARDLGIGGPRGGQYDDGGLVDLNRAPPGALVSALGVTAEVAEQVVATREAWGAGYSSIEEVLAHVTVSEHQAGVIRDRGIVLPR